MNACSICNSADLNLFYEKLYDDRYGYPGRFRILQCSDCRHKALECDFSPEMLSRLYTEYYPRATFDTEEHQPHKEVRGFHAWFNGDYASAFRWVPKSVRILDIGCGFGEALGYHKLRGCEVYGVEADENVRRIAEKFGYNVRVGLFDPVFYENDFFDYVTADQVIEHVTHPLDFMKDIYKILKPGGCVILSTPNSNGWGAKFFGRFWINWHVPYHLQYFTSLSMKVAAEKAGFVMEKWMTITVSEWLFYQWIHLVTFPAMGQPSGFWSPKGKLTLIPKIAFKLISIFHKTKINHMLTRVFDGLRLGDNYVFMLRKPL